jgi:hypothetical protein
MAGWNPFNTDHATQSTISLRGRIVDYLIGKKVYFESPVTLAGNEDLDYYKRTQLRKFLQLAILLNSCRMVALETLLATETTANYLLFGARGLAG